MKDPIAVLGACVYCAALGWFFGRIMLRNEQGRAAELRSIHRNIADVYDAIYKLQHPTPDILSTPEPAAAA